LEHAAIVPDPELVRGLRVVTQPGFLADRGERYLREVDPDDLVHLYRFASLIDAGAPTVASSDAPYGPADPWATIRAARDRTIGPAERVPARTTLAGYLTDADFRPRRVAVGAPADLVLLHTSLDEALDALDALVVRHTWINGHLHDG
jgi:predicted amidohydrolase YtcJ